MTFKAQSLILIAIMLGLTIVVAAQDRPTPRGTAEAPLVVAVREAPPFAMQDIAGNWQGLSVDLWQDVADKLDLTFKWTELSLDQTLAALENGEVDLAVAALSITTERERRFDFSHPYFVSGLSLAYQSGRKNAWLATLRGFLSLEFLSAVGSLALVLLIAGLAVWLFERKANPDEFGGGKAIRGLGDGFWWSAVTMTTVGYGDKAPKTVGGRAVALIWMFASLIIIAGFTASIAASLTANRLESNLLRARSLATLRVGVLQDSAAEDYAVKQGATVRRFATIKDLLQALQGDRVDVVLHDAPILKHYVRGEYDDLEVASKVLVRDDYGFGLQNGSPLRKDINAALLSILHEPVWQDIRLRYLGSDNVE